MITMCFNFHQFLLRLSCNFLGQVPSKWVSFWGTHCKPATETSRSSPGCQCLGGSSATVALLLPESSGVQHLGISRSQSSLKMRAVSPRLLPDGSLNTYSLLHKPAVSSPHQSVFSYLFKFQCVQLSVSSKSKSKHVILGRNRLSPSEPFNSQSSWSVANLPHVDGVAIWRHWSRRSLRSS